MRSEYVLISLNKPKSSYTSHLSFKAWILKQFKSLHPFFLRMVSHFATWPNKHFVGSKSLSSRYRTAFRLRRKITYLLRVQEFCSCSELRQLTSAHKQIIPWQHFPTLLPAPPDKECRSKLLSQWQMDLVWGPKQFWSNQLLKRCCKTRRHRYKITSWIF